MKKSIIILNIYDDLLSGKIVDATICCERYDISIATFYRYITVIRHFVKEKNRILRYDRKRKTYKCEVRFSESVD